MTNLYLCLLQMLLIMLLTNSPPLSDCKTLGHPNSWKTDNNPLLTQFADLFVSGISQQYLEKQSMMLKNILIVMVRFRNERALFSI